MFDVNLINKSKDSITKEIKRNINLIKTLKIPDNSNKNSYNIFIDEIAKSFNIKNKKEIILLAINQDEDEIPIKNQEDLEEYMNEILYFNIYLEKVINEKKEKDDSDEDENDFDFQIDINMEIKEKEILNNYNKVKTIKQEERKDNLEYDDIVFNI